MGRGNENRCPTTWPDLSNLGVLGVHSLLEARELSPCFREILGSDTEERATSAPFLGMSRKAKVILYTLPRLGRMVSPLSWTSVGPVA